MNESEPRGRGSIREFRITRTLEDIPEPGDCPACGGATRKTVVSYSIEGSKYVVGNSTAPGYECSDCGAEFYDRETDVQLLTLAAEMLDKSSDHSLRAAIYANARESCDAVIRAIAQTNVLEEE